MTRADRPGPGDRYPHAVRSPLGVGFLLSQLGMFASGRYAELVGRLDLTPPQTGVLRLIADSPGLSQQALAEQLGILPSRVVGLIDDLESRSLVERTRNPNDRRLYALTLTEAGTAALAEIMTTGAEHERGLCAGLSDDEHEQLAGLLRKVAESHGVPLNVHIGFRLLS